MGWKLASSEQRMQASTRQKPQCLLWGSLTSEITLLPYSIAHTDQLWHSGEGTTQGCDYQEERHHWGPSWSLATIPIKMTIDTNGKEKKWFLVTQEMESRNPNDFLRAEIKLCTKPLQVRINWVCSPLMNLDSLMNLDAMFKFKLLCPVVFISRTLHCITYFLNSQRTNSPSPTLPVSVALRVREKYFF